MAKRGQNEGSIYQRDDGRWVGQLNLGYIKGKRKRKYVYGATRKEVQQQLTQALTDQQRGLPVAAERQTIEQYLTRWLEDVVQHTVRPRTYDSYRQIVRLHVVPALGRIQLHKLTAQHVQALMNYKLKSGLSPRTVQYIRAVLRRALNQAVKWDLVARNVVILTEPPKSKRFEIQPFNAEQARRFLDAVQDDRLEALFSVAIAVGLRQGEALGLRWDDVDLDAGTLTVRYQLQRLDGKLQLVEPKTARSRRTIALPAVAVRALRRHRMRQREERLFAGSRWQESGLVFTSTIGTPLEPRNVTRRFHELIADAGLPRQRFHDLRHTCASLLLAQGVHPRVVMETLGHSQISLTMNTYSHVVPALQREAAERMDSLLSRSG